MKTKAQQVMAIKNVLGKKSKIPDYRFTFGRYKDEYLDDVVGKNPNYLIWCYNNDIKLPNKVIRYIQEELL